LLKAELRKAVKTRLAALSAGQLTASGLAAARHLSRVPRWGEFRSVLVFFSMKSEIDTLPIIETVFKAGKSLFAPRIEGENLAFYQFSQQNTAVTGNARRGLADGYREPEADPAFILKKEDFPALVITPGLAFDRRLNRLGRGRGYYDRFFATLDSEIRLEPHAPGRNYTALGLCMDCQLVEEVPVEPCDKTMDLLLTESGLIP